MMKALFLALILTSCAERNFSANQFKYHDSGAPKPRIALVPVIATKPTNLPWDLSSEFTDVISEKFLETKQFFLTKDFSVLGKHLTDLSEINPLLEDIKWLYENASTSEFIVFIELVEHNLTPKKSRIPPQSYFLDIAFRVHVIDIRSPEPKVILQELIQDTFNISIMLDYSSENPGKTAFFLSPLGMAHTQMVKRITKQIQEYILLSKI